MHPDFTPYEYTVDGEEFGPAIYCRTPNEFVMVDCKEIAKVAFCVVGVTAPTRCTSRYIHIRDMLDGVMQTGDPLAIRVTIDNSVSYVFFIASPLL